MWIGGGGAPPPLCFGRLQKPKKVQKFWKIIAQKRCKYQCFCFLRLVAMENVIFEFVGIYGVHACVFTNTVNTSVFGLLKNTVKYSISDMLCCESVANNGVFATLVVLGFA